MIHVVVDNIACVKADAVIRLATDIQEPTTSTTRPNQVDGPVLPEQLRAGDPLGVGAATVTKGGALTTEFVIHAIVRNVSDPVTPDGLRRALVSALQRAAAWQFRAVALPLVGTGPGELPRKDAAQILCDVLRAHTREQSFPCDISIVVETAEDKTVLDSLIEVVDA